MIELLITILVLTVVAYVAFWVLGQIPMPEPIRTVVLVVVAIILLLILLQRVGWV